MDRELVNHTLEELKRSYVAAMQAANAARREWERRRNEAQALQRTIEAMEELLGGTDRTFVRRSVRVGSSSGQPEIVVAGGDTVVTRAPVGDGRLRVPPKRVVQAAPSAQAVDHAEPSSAQVVAPSTSDALRVIFQASPRKRWRIRDLMAELITRDWVPVVENPDAAVRAALNRLRHTHGLIERVGHGEYVWRGTAEGDAALGGSQEATGSGAPMRSDDRPQVAHGGDHVD